MGPIITTVVTGIFSVVVAVLTSSWFAKKMMKDDRIDALSKDIKDIGDRQKKMEDTLDTWKEQNECLTDANVALLKDRFEHLSNTALTKGSISMNELNAIIRLSVVYFKLDDEDGTGHNLLERVKQLPLEKPRHETR